MSLLDAVLAEHRICICAGSGGVGKTTTAAALAAGAAARGRTVAVVTIDPAKRLANSLGLSELDNEPQRIDDALLAEHGLPVGEGGALYAMTLDSKRTFDALIEKLAPDERSARDVLENRIYQQLSNAVAGSQEYTAMAKLYELHLEGRFDLIVLDTPPSRNALDFLDAPDRLTGFFTGRAVRMFLKPAGLGGRLLGAGSGVVFGLLKRVTGVDLLRDLSVFFRSFGGMIDAFTERAEGTKALLADAGTTFVIVSSPEHEPVEEAIYFRRKLEEARLPFGALIVNRVTTAPSNGTAELPEPLAEALGERLAGRVVAAAHDIGDMAARDEASLDRLERELGAPPTVRVPQFDGDVHDLDGLALMAGHLLD